MLVSANRILAPESTRTRRFLVAPPTAVTDGESEVKMVKIESWLLSAAGGRETVKVELKIKVGLKVRDDTGTDELSRDSHNCERRVRRPSSPTR